MTERSRGEDPDRLAAWRRYLRFWRPDPAADVADELRFHLESAVAEYVAGGMSPAGARAEAERRFGNIAGITSTLHHLTHERERAMAWRDRWDTVRADLRFALRQLRRSPGFTAVAVLTLALGIGANSAIFSVVYGVLLRPLPYAHAERLLDLRERFGPAGRGGMVVTFGNFAVWQQEARSFEAIGGYTWGGGTLTGAGDPRVVSLLRASASYWKALYIPPVLGRYFGAAEDRPDAPHVIVLSYALWQTAFAADSSIIGRPIMLSGEPYTVIGVAPAGYALRPQSNDAWVPLALTQAQVAEHSDHELSVVGLVRAGVPAERAVAELTRIEARLATEYPHSYFDGGIVARPLRDSVVGPVRALLLILFGAVGLVLLIACVNVASLLLARAAVRQKEVAVRSALGAGRGRIVAQFLAESLLLALAGAAAGIGVAIVGIRLLVSNNPLGVPRLQEAALDAPVLALTVLLALLCGVAFGLFPALRASRPDLQRALREGSRQDTGSVRQGVRSALVVLQVSIAMVLLLGAGLLVRSALLLQRVPPGFDTHNLLVAGLGLPSSRYPTDTAVAQRYAEIQRAVAALPGVASVALVSRIPIGAFGADCGAFRREGSAPNDGSAVGANVRTATGNFFETMHIPLLRGRSFLSSDVPGAPGVVMVNRRLAHELFGSEDAIGRRIGCQGASGTEPSWSTIVGITGDLHASGLAADIQDEVYYPATRRMPNSMYLVLRGTVPVTTLTPAIRHAIASLDPLLPLSGVRTMDDIVRQSLATPRFTSALLTCLGGIGLLLAVIGIYGVIAYVVAQRTQEIGIRMALGASTGRVVGMVVRQGLALALAGIAIGAAASLLFSRVLASQLYGVSPRDPLTFVIVALLLAVVATAASFAPARRAARVDPLAALRGA